MTLHNTLSIPENCHHDFLNCWISNSFLKEILYGTTAMSCVGRWESTHHFSRKAPNTLRTECMDRCTRDNLLGSHFLPPTLNGNNYGQFLENYFPVLLEDFPLQMRNNCILCMMVHQHIIHCMWGVFFMLHLNRTG